MLLSALGVPRETILADYMMVNTFTAEVVESRLEELNERLQNPQLIDCLRELMQVQEAILSAYFRRLRMAMAQWIPFWKRKWDYVQRKESSFGRCIWRAENNGRRAGIRVAMRDTALFQTRY